MLVTQTHIDPEGQEAMRALYERNARTGGDPTLLEVARTGTSLLSPAISEDAWAAAARTTHTWPICTASG